MKFLQDWLKFQLCINAVTFAIMTIMFFGFIIASAFGWFPPPTS